MRSEDKLSKALLGVFPEYRSGTSGHTSNISLDVDKIGGNYGPTMQDWVPWDPQDGSGLQQLIDTIQRIK